MPPSLIFYWTPSFFLQKINLIEVKVKKKKTKKQEGVCKYWLFKTIIKDSEGVRDKSRKEKKLLKSFTWQQRQISTRGDRGRRAWCLL